MKKINKIIACSFLFTNLFALGNKQTDAKPIVLEYMNKHDTRTSKPMIVSLAVASNSTKNALQALQANNLFYNIMIDLVEQKIYYFTNDETKEMTESVEQIRPRAIGVSVHVTQGFLPIRNVNDIAVAVGLIRGEGTFENKKAYDFFATALQTICDQFNIPKHKVLNYPMLAIHPDGTYGRQSVERSQVINFKKLAEEYGLGLWPKAEDFSNNPPFPPGLHKEAEWVSTALRKLGMLAKPTDNPNDEQLVSAVSAFQKHFQCSTTDGSFDKQTIYAINSLLKQLEKLEPKTQTVLPRTLEKGNKQKHKSEDTTGTEKAEVKESSQEKEKKKSFISAFFSRWF